MQDLWYLGKHMNSGGVSSEEPLVITPVKRDGLRTEVAKSLREAIFNQSLRPGDQVREIEMATKIGVSRGPLREALLILQKEGLIEIRPNRGAFIRKMTNEE